MKLQAGDLQKFIEKQIQALDSLCRKSGGDTGVTDNDVRVLRDMLEENDILEHMPLFGMMTVYAQRQNMNSVIRFTRKKTWESEIWQS